MSRIEKNQPIMKEMEEMKGELKTVAKEGKRGRHRYRSCFFIVLFICFALFGFVAWTVVATGLIQVPLLTPIAFHPSVPAREVPVGVPLLTALSTQPHPGQLRLTEGTLTSFVRDQLSTRSQSFFDADGAQVDLQTSEGIEVSLPVRDNDLGSNVVVYLNVTVESGAFSVELQRASIGSWNVPMVLTRGVLDPLIASAMTELNSTMSEFCTPTSVERAQGTLIIICSP